MSAIIELIQDDITKLKVDAIVNAANSHLASGGGVDGAIHRAAGPELLTACQKIYKQQGECTAGNAIITPAFSLPSKYVIHAVGPIWNGGGAAEADKLFRVYVRCLNLALEYECKSVAFPNISTGVYGFPKLKAANIALSTMMDFLSQDPRAQKTFEKIYLVCFDQENYDIYFNLLHPQREKAVLLNS